MSFYSKRVNPAQKSETWLKHLVYTHAIVLICFARDSQNRSALGYLNNVNVKIHVYRTQTFTCIC